MPDQRGPRAAGTSYRADIQGLRAIAVGLVVLAHAGVAALPGGYVGVDVFFVVSGFVITGQLAGALERDGSLDLAGFFARRVRRIVPAALVAIAATVAIGLAVMAPLAHPRLLGDAIAAALFVPNLAFAAQDTDYLAGDEPSVLQHFWSLGVEEQFYLVWPALLAVAFLVGRRRRGALVVAAVVVAVCSFAAAVWLTPISQPWAFFGLPTRAWEFAVGGVLALALRPRQAGGRADAAITSPIGGRLPVPPTPSRLDGAFGALLAWTGLALIAAAALAFTEELAYPRAFAALPVAGTALAIAGGASRHPLSPRALLASRPFVFVGTISYSLYLVHWPMQLLPQAALVAGGEVPFAARLALAAASVPVAWLLYRLVEERFRAPSVRRAGAVRPWRPVVAGIAASALVAVSCLTLTATTAVAAADDRAATDEPLPLRPVGSAAPAADAGRVVPAPAAAIDDLPAIFDDGCHLGRAAVDPVGCPTGDAGPDVVVFGDSHAAHWAPAFTDLANRGLLRYTNHTKSACPSVDIPTLFRGNPYPQCDEWRAAVLAELRAAPPDVVVLSNHGASTFDVPRGDVPDRYREGLERVIAQLPPASRVVVIGQTPDLGFDPAICVSAHADALDRCSAAVDTAIEPPIRDAERAAVAASGGRARLAVLDEWFCTDASCPAVSGNVLVYRDRHHVTATFAVGMADELGRIVGVLPAR